MTREAAATPSAHPAPPVPMLVACTDGPWLAELARHPEARVVMQAPAARPVAALLAQQLADALVVEAGLVPEEEWAALVRYSRQVAPGLRVVLLLPERAGADAARHAHAAGADGVIPWPWPVDAVLSAAGAEPPWRVAYGGGGGRPGPVTHPGPAAGPAFPASAADSPPLPPPRPAGGPRILPPQLVVVTGPKGGVGKTFVAVNLACAVAHRAPFEAALADWDLTCPDAGALLDLDGGPTVADLAARPGSAQGPEVRRYLVRHGPTGLHVLLGPHRPEDAEGIEPQAGAAVLGLLRREFPFVVVDTGPSGADDLVFEAVEQATRIVAVTTPDAAALRQTRIFVETLKRLNIPLDERVTLVLNRTTPADRVGPARAAEFLGVPVRVVVPADPRHVEAAAFDGKPLILGAPGSPAGRALERLVALACPGLEAAPRRRFGLSWPGRPRGVAGRDPAPRGGVPATAGPARGAEAQP